MSDFNMLGAVKNALGITGNYQDDTLRHYIDDVNYFLEDAGVPHDLIGTAPTAGAVSRGVADLWRYGAGDGKLSPYFYARVIQLSAGHITTEGGE